MGASQPKAPRVVQKGDRGLLAIEVIDVSDAFMDMTIATVRVPARLGGPGLLCVQVGEILPAPDGDTEQR